MAYMMMIIIIITIVVVIRGNDKMNDDSFIHLLFSLFTAASLPLDDRAMAHRALSQYAWRRKVEQQPQQQQQQQQQLAGW